MICKNCGYQIDDNSSFCVNCGAMVNAPQPEPQAPIVQQPVINEYEYNSQPSYEDPSMVEAAKSCIKKAATAMKLSIVSLVVPPAFCAVALLFCWCAIIPVLNIMYGFFMGFVGTLAPLAVITCLILAFVTRSSIKKLPEVTPEGVNFRLYEQYQAALKKAKTSKILNFVVLGIVGAIIAIFLLIIVIAFLLGGLGAIVGVVESLAYNSSYYY